MSGDEPFRPITAVPDSRYASLAWSTWLVALFVIAALIRLACDTGIIGSDDLWYARYAQQITSGQFPLSTNQFAGRTGVTLVVAAAYRLFGVGEVGTIIGPLLASSASVPLLAVIGARLFGPVAGSIAALFLCTSPIHVRFATILVPEPLMEFWILLGVWCYLEALRRSSRWLGLVAGVAIGIAYLTKEPAAFVAPALILAGWLTGRRWLAIVVMAGALAVAGAEIATYTAVFRAPLHRVDSARVGVASFSDADLVRFKGGMSRREYLTRRLFLEYPRRMAVPTVDFGLHYMAALILGAVGVLLLRNGTVLLLSWAAIPWLFLNFGSASLSQYVPLYPAERYISLALPPLFVLGGGVLAASMSLRDARVRASAVVAVALVCVVGVACGLLTRGTGFRVNQMTALRAIVTRASTQATVPCHASNDAGHVTGWENERMDMWTEALRIFERRPSSATQTRSLVITQDVLGLPRSEPGTCDHGEARDRRADAIPVARHE